jgi:hypothetical protein
LCSSQLQRQRFALTNRSAERHRVALTRPWEYSRLPSIAAMEFALNHR